MLRPFTTLLALLLTLEMATASPIERFSESIDLSCAADEACGVSARSSGSLGARFGVAFAAGHRGGAHLRTRGAGEARTFEVNTFGVGIGALTLSWDGDPHPHQLSSAGLGCLNLRSGGGIAFQISRLEIRAACDTEGDWEGCQPLTVESRVYDPSDPTGQRYSASLLRVKIPREGAALEVPFSNFVQRGPRGAGSFECVGAVSISIKLEGQRDLTIMMGAIDIIGGAGPLVSTPTSAPTVTAIPRATEPSQQQVSLPTLTATAAVQVEPPRLPEPQPSPRSGTEQQGTPASRGPGQAAASPIASRKGGASNAPGATRTSAPEGVTPRLTPAPKVLPDVPAQDPAQEGSVFGAVVASPLSVTPAPATKGRRRLWD